MYLGHKIGSGTLAVPKHRADALANFRQPRTKKELRSFLGTASYYRQFIPGFAAWSSALTPATSLKSPLRVCWSEEMTSAFSKLKTSLCDSCVLVIPSSEDVFVLHTDASGRGIGACLHVVRKDRELPAGFFSRQLRGAEKNYSVTELESLAILAALKHFEFHVYGKEITVVTDHKPCLALLGGVGLNKRLLRFALALQQFHITIIHRPGAVHCNADGMSRQSWPADEFELKSESAHWLSASPSGRSLGGEDVGGREKKTTEREREEKIKKKREESKQ